LFGKHKQQNIKEYNELVDSQFTKPSLMTNEETKLFREFTVFLSTGQSLENCRGKKDLNDLN
jgi:hypothetical protein